MRIYCPYSGETFQVEGFSSTTLVTSVHPIFQAPTEKLLQRAADWAHLRFDQCELKLLFLALLHSTGQVEFRTVATPSVQVIHNNMERLFKFLAWRTDVLSPQLKLPRFVISRETRDLSCVPQWLESWEYIRQRWEMAIPLRHLQEKQCLREQALERLIRSPEKDTESYAGKLAQWAMDAAAVPEALREYWTDLLKLRGFAVYTARTVDLEEMLEHFEEHLQAGSIYAFKVLEHSRTLLAKNRAGLNYALGIEIETNPNFDPLANAANPFHIVEDSVETENRQTVAATAPKEEPRERDYPNKVAYLRAKAAWTLACKEQEKIDAFAAREATMLQEAELDSIALAHSDMVENEETSEQLTEYLSIKILSNNTGAE